MMSTRAGALLPESLTLLGHALLERDPAVNRGRANHAAAMLSAPVRFRRLRTMFRLQGIGCLLSRAGA